MSNHTASIGETQADPRHDSGSMPKNAAVGVHSKLVKGRTWSQYPGPSSGNSLWTDGSNDLKDYGHPIGSNKRRTWFSRVSPCLLFLAIIVVFAVSMSFLKSRGGKAPIGGTWSCSPGGDFQFEPGYLYLSASTLTWPLIFSVTLGFGRFSFPVAKLIDIIWDITIGRGGQAIIALICCSVLSRSLLIASKQPVVPLKLYAMNALKAGGMSALKAQATSLFTRNTTGHLTFTILGAIYMTAFALSFPTMMSAFTSYQPYQEPYVAIPGVNYTNSSLISPAYLEPVYFLLKDGARVGQANNQPITGNDTLLFTTMVQYLLDAGFLSLPSSGRLSNGSCAPGYYNDTLASGFSFCSCSNLWSLQPADPRDFCYFNMTQNPATVDLSTNQTDVYTRWALGDTPASNVNPPLDVTLYYAPDRDGPFAFENNSYEYSYLLANGLCEPLNIYKWGFSSVGLVIILSTSFVFSLITGIFYLQIQRHSESSDTREHLGMWCTIRDIASVLTDDLKDGVDAMSNEEMKKTIKERRVKFTRPDSAFTGVEGEIKGERQGDVSTEYRSSAT